MSAEITALTPDETARALVQERINQAGELNAIQRQALDNAALKARIEARSIALGHAMSLQGQRGVARKADDIINDAQSFLRFLLGVE